MCSVGDLLNQKEVKILQMIADGGTVRQMAVDLKLSPHYIKSLKRSIYSKLSAVSASNAVAIGLREGIIK